MTVGRMSTVSTMWLLVPPARCPGILMNSGT
jgi:hypothetical protein